MNKQMLASAFCVALCSEKAFAAEGPVHGTWGIAFWVFTGYCCLIVIPQALRAFRFLLTSGGGEAKKGQPCAARDTAT